MDLQNSCLRNVELSPNYTLQSRRLRISVSVTKIELPPQKNRLIFFYRMGEVLTMQNFRNNSNKYNKAHANVFLHFLVLVTKVLFHLVPEAGYPGFSQSLDENFRIPS